MYIHQIIIVHRVKQHNKIYEKCLKRRKKYNTEVYTHFVGENKKKIKKKVDRT